MTTDRHNQAKISEEEVILNSRTNFLYSNEFEKGRFFQVVYEDEKEVLLKFAERTMLKIIYIKNQDDIEGFEIIKLVSEKEKERVKLSKFNFAQLRSFLSFINQIDLKGITERRLKILNDEEELDEEVGKKIKTLLSQNGGQEIVETLLEEGIITSKDIVNTGFRKRSLKIFRNLLDDADYWKKYCEESGISNQSEEKTWQYFFENNEWIFGYGLDYRFKSILQREAHLSSAELDGSNSVIGDYLLGDKRFTTFVELKKPSTSLFGKAKNRSNSWRLSNDLIDSVSQILEHKAAGTLRLEQDLYDGNGNKITQKSYDSKVILVIGKWDEVEDSINALEKKIKTKTLELYRMDSRNIDIMTYDELYERAKYIVEGINNFHKDTSDQLEDNLPF